jgi:transglutaminase-like putative cysteine protease
MNARGAARRTIRTKTLFALAAAIVLAVAACSAGAEPNEAALADESPPIFTDTPSSLSFADPVSIERPIFEVEVDDPEYWRMFTLDRYGWRWDSTNRDKAESGVRISTPATLPGSDVVPPPSAETLEQTFKILSDFDTLHAIPMAQTAVEIAGPIGQITFDPEGSEAFVVDTQLETGMEYTVRSRVVVPTPEELNRVDHRAPRTYGRWTELPPDLDPRIRQIAERWTAGAESAYQKVLAIQQRFQRDDFVYDVDVVTPVHDDGLVEFLTRTKAGYCNHYSSAMAVMVRALGLPARIGVGFRAGRLQEDGSYVVTSADAHSWVEVLFPGYGWLQFEPEHGAEHPNAEPGTYLNPAMREDGSDGQN